MNPSYYIARDSGSAEIADRLIDSITDRFHLLVGRPYVGRLREDLRPGLSKWHQISGIQKSSQLQAPTKLQLRPHFWSLTG
jgi:plasmid stabilization system protein ParE